MVVGVSVTDGTATIVGSVVMVGTAVTWGGVSRATPGTVGGNGVIVGADPPLFPLQALKNMKVIQIKKNGKRFDIYYDTSGSILRR
jgi:hypothetical protein